MGLPSRRLEPPDGRHADRASVPWGRVVASGVTVAPADRVPDLLPALPRVLSARQVAWLADRARLRFHAAA